MLQRVVLLLPDEVPLGLVLELPLLGLVLLGLVVLELLLELPRLELPELVRPARVSVHRLDHIATVEPTAGAGTVLAAAVDAWLSEWLPTEPEDDREVTLWIGGNARTVAPLGALGDLVEGA